MISKQVFKSKKWCAGLFLTQVCLCTSALSSEMVYTPVNPTFGGNPNNAPGLLATAQSQNGNKAPVIPTAAAKTPLQNFNTYLENLILNRLASETMTSLFGTGGTLNAGTYDAAGFVVKITPDGTGNLTIKTTDRTTNATAEFTISATGTL